MFVSHGRKLSTPETGVKRRGVLAGRAAAVSRSFDALSRASALLKGIVTYAARH
jgi:hypothetical protein